MSRALAQARRSAIRFPVDPLMVPPEKVARRLGVTLAGFEAKREELERAGFPKVDSVLGTYCLEAVDQWVRSRHGGHADGKAITDPATIMDRVRSRPWRK